MAISFEKALRKKKTTKLPSVKEPSILETYKGNKFISKASAGRCEFGPFFGWLVPEESIEGVKSFTNHRFMSGCKAHLQDNLATELVKMVSKDGIFKEGVGYCALDVKHDDAKLLRVLKAINFAEKELKVRPKTKIVKANAGYVAVVPHYWFRTTHLISMWSLIIRIAYVGYKNDKEQSPKDFLYNYVGDHWENAGIPQYNGKKKYKYFVENGPVIIEPKDIGNVTPHNAGIVNLKVPGIEQPPGSM